MLNVLVTGATGFVGGALLEHLSKCGHRVRAAVRGRAAQLPAAASIAHVGELAPTTDWSAALDGMDVVVHCAARVHVLKESAADPLAAFRFVNVAATLHLARQAVAAGVKRFVFISSIGVNGAETHGRPYTVSDPARPHSPYAVSKHEAELELQALAASSGLEVVIIRPPLVFGPNAPGNFQRLMQALHRGIPMPLGAIHNRRSLVALENLVDLIETCARHPAAAQQTFLVSDGEDVSTTALLRRVAAALGRPPRLLPVPGGLLRAVAQVLGKADFAQRLCGSLQVDIAHTQALLGWKPVVTLDEALARTARHFLTQAER
ncbi:UDP-glucose 4-epimerase family protein [Rubrivivax rivuli]|uniref:UDP-glucose 4-epimerase family protein n=1 Tax=Rubrivivax rivuli TaxID=1862385 RepID=UPI002873EF32|nr:SDR family oxidoreductase [Rubrivivax rivuli]